VGRDPALGHLFENLVIMEALKERLDRAESAPLYFDRDSTGNAVDLLIPDAEGMHAVEIKAGGTAIPTTFAASTTLPRPSREPRCADRCCRVANRHSNAVAGQCLHGAPWPPLPEQPQAMRAFQPYKPCRYQHPAEGWAASCWPASRRSR